MNLEKVRVINAAGKLTALGGSAQSKTIANAQAAAAQLHLDMSALREEVASQIANLCCAEAACVTSGAAAGITISVAAMICRDNPELGARLPQVPDRKAILIQAGHNINFGADIEQMIHMAGADTVIAGTKAKVTESDIKEALRVEPIGLLYVQSHHCIQENRVDLASCIELANKAGVPVIVDAAAEDDLQKYIAMGADLVTYSGGKAFGGPTSGFIAGRHDLVELCEHQFRGIARPMKVSKEQLTGLSLALSEYASRNHEAILVAWDQLNQKLVDAFAHSSIYRLETKPDEAGRNFERVSVIPNQQKFDCRDLVQFLADSTPSIRTRNHQINEQRVLIDPRELSEADMGEIITRLREFESNQ